MNDPFGRVQQPTQVSGLGADPGVAIGNLIQLVFNVMIIAGGIYALLNFILAGYAFLSAGDNPKGVESAWARIYQSIIGLVFLVGSFVLGALVGQLVFGDPQALLNPQLPTIQ